MPLLSLLLILYPVSFISLSYLSHLSLSPPPVSFNSPFSLLSLLLWSVFVSLIYKEVYFLPLFLLSFVSFLFSFFIALSLFHYLLPFLSCQFSLLSSNLVLFSPIFLFFVLLPSFTSLLFFCSCLPLCSLLVSQVAHSCSES